VVKIAGKTLAQKKRDNLARAAESWKRGEAGVSHFPPVVYIEPASICNLSCPMCPVTLGVSEYQYPEKFLAMDVIKKMREPLEHALRVFLSGGGEPLLHPEFVGIMEFMKALDLEIFFNTNATLVDAGFAKVLVELKVDCVSVSIDAIDPGRYRAIRKGAEIDQALAGLAAVNAAKKSAGADRPLVNMQFTLMKENLDQLPLLAEFAHEYSINHLVVEPLSPVFNFDRGYQEFFRQQFAPADQALHNSLNDLKAQAKDLGFFFSSHYLEEKRLPAKCGQPWLNFGIRTNGRTFLCCGTAEKMGSLNQTDFAGVWNGEAYRNFRSEIARGKYPEPCGLCLQESRSPWFNHELLEP